MSNYMQQCRGIIVNNIISSHRNHYFWKHFALQLIFLLLFVIGGQLQVYSISNLLLVNQLENILAIMASCQFLISQYSENRNRFFSFYKTNGINTFVYLFTWIVYSLILGVVQISFYVGFLLSYMKYYAENYLGQSSLIDVSQFYTLMVSTFLSTYAYTFFFAVLIPTKLIGLKLINALFIVSYYLSIVLLIGDVPQYQKWWYATPVDFYIISEYGLINFITISQEELRTVFLLQFFIPLVLGMVIQICKMSSASISHKIIRRLKSLKHSKLNETFITHIEMKEMEGNQCVLQMQNVWKRFGKYKGLNNINLAIEVGQLIILSGKNGSGKSTLLNIITQPQTNDEGRVVRKKGLRVGISTEENFFHSELTVKENLIFYGEIKGVGQISKRINYILEMFQLNEFANKKEYKISFGSKRKLSIACAFLGNNDLVLLDQPLMGIDLRAKEQVMRILGRIRQRQKSISILISTADPGVQLIELADRLLYIERGEIILNQKISFLAKAKVPILARFYPLRTTNSYKKIQEQISQIPQMKLVKQTTQCLQYKMAEQKLSEIHNLCEEISKFAKVEILTPNLREKLKMKIDEVRMGSTTKKDEQINRYLMKIEEIKMKPTFLKQILATLIIKYYQILPNVESVLFYCFGYLICTAYFASMLKKGQNQYILTISFYPMISTYLYIHISINELDFKSTSHEITMHSIGLKTMPFWLTGCLFNILLITFPVFLQYVWILSESDGKINTYNMQEVIYNIFAFAISFTVMCYFYTVFFVHSFICLSFITTIIMALNAISNIILQQTQINDTTALLNFIQVFDPYQSYNQCFYNWFDSKCVQFPIFQIFLYSSAFLIVNFCLFKIKIAKKKLAQSSIIENEFNDALSEKIRVLNIIQTNNHQEIVLDNVFLQYSKRKVTVLKNINLAIPKGTAFGLIGRNGSGKSTIIKLITAQISKTMGDVWFGGKNILSQNSQIFEKFGLSPQVNYLIPEMTVESHLRTLWLIKGVPISIYEALSRQLLTIFEMEEYYHRSIGELSVGYKRRLRFISAIVGAPKYLFLDEPSIGIDEDTQLTIGHLATQLMAHFGTTVVWITHNIEEAQRYCHRVGVLSRGEFIKMGSPSDLTTEFSRGYNMNLFSKQIEVLQTTIVPLLEREFQVYEVKEKNHGSALSVNIPLQRFKMASALSIIQQLKKNKVIERFELVVDKLEEVFHYLISTDSSILKEEDSLAAND